MEVNITSSWRTERNKIKRIHSQHRHDDIHYVATPPRKIYAKSWNQTELQNSESTNLERRNQFDENDETIPFLMSWLQTTLNHFQGDCLHIKLSTDLMQVKFGATSSACVGLVVVELRLACREINQTSDQSDLFLRQVRPGSQCFSTQPGKFANMEPKIWSCKWICAFKYVLELHTSIWLGSCQIFKIQTCLLICYI